MADRVPYSPSAWAMTVVLFRGDRTLLQLDTDRAMEGPSRRRVVVAIVADDFNEERASWLALYWRVDSIRTLTLTWRWLSVKSDVERRSSQGVVRAIRHRAPTCTWRRARPPGSPSNRDRPESCDRRDTLTPPRPPHRPPARRRPACRCPLLAFPRRSRPGAWQTPSAA